MILQMVFIVIFGLGNQLFLLSAYGQPESNLADYGDGGGVCQLHRVLRWRGKLFWRCPAFGTTGVFTAMLCVPFWRRSHSAAGSAYLQNAIVPMQPEMIFIFAVPCRPYPVAICVMVFGLGNFLLQTFFLMWEI